ncbi:MAG TPA: hypothetical protein VEA40_00130 [Ramlibacter sp.]|nr:hypothetical protein [Ramlibacter sp.]
MPRTAPATAGAWPRAVLFDLLTALLDSWTLRDFLGGLGQGPRKTSYASVELPRAESVSPAELTALIQRGLQHEVPALEARGEYLD